MPYVRSEIEDLGGTRDGCEGSNISESEGSNRSGSEGSNRSGSEGSNRHGDDISRSLQTRDEDFISSRYDSFTSIEGTHASEEDNLASSKGSDLEKCTKKA